MSNPYTLVFGQPPLEMIERTEQVERIVSEFTQEHPANCLNLITGIRGSGKTVFLTEIAHRLEKKKEWFVVNLNSQRDLLESLVAKLNGHPALYRIFKEAKISIQIFGQGITISGASPARDMEDILIQMLRSMQKKGKRLLITLDEATNSKDFRVFATAYQMFIREGLPAFLLMTGLQPDIDRLRNASGMTFLERAPRTVLQPLNFHSMVEKYTNTLQIDVDEAIRLANASKGYSFAFQIIGFFAWGQPHEIELTFNKSKEYLNEYAYHKIWSELSRRDREVVIAIHRSGDGEVARIRRVLNFTTNQFNPYRERLIRAGVAYSPKNGYLELSLPWFGEYAEEQKMMETMED